MNRLTKVNLKRARLMNLLKRALTEKVVTNGRHFLNRRFVISLLNTTDKDKLPLEKYPLPKNLTLSDITVILGETFDVDLNTADIIEPHDMSCLCWDDNINNLFSKVIYALNKQDNEKQKLKKKRKNKSE